MLCKHDVEIKFDVTWVPALVRYSSKAQLCTIVMLYVELKERTYMCTLHAKETQDFLLMSHVHLG